MDQNSDDVPKACAANDVEGLRRMIALESEKSTYHDYDRLFLCACSDGYKEIAQLLLDYSHQNRRRPIDIHYAYSEDTVDGYEYMRNHESAFINACSNGHLDIAKWLVQICNIDININDDEPFCEACFNGHLDIAQWLVEIGNVNIHVNNDEPLHHAYENNHTHVVHWLLSIK